MPWVDLLKLFENQIVYKMISRRYPRELDFVFLEELPEFSNGLCLFFHNLLANNNYIADCNFLKSYTCSSVLSNIFSETPKILFSSKLQFILVMSNSCIL